MRRGECIEKRKISIFCEKRTRGNLVKTEKKNEERMKEGEKGEGEYGHLIRKY